MHEKVSCEEATPPPNGGTPSDALLMVLWLPEVGCVDASHWTERSPGAGSKILADVRFVQSRTNPASLPKNVEYSGLYKPIAGRQNALASNPTEEFPGMNPLRPMACAAVLVIAAAPVAAQEYDCLIEARDTVEIRSSVEGIIEKVLVRRGDAVQRGQVLVQLESGAERAAVDLARSKATMEGPLKAAESRLDFAVTKERRTAELFKQNFVSAGALDEARTQRELAESELREARENRKLNELELQRAEEVLKLRAIRSPFDGVVVERYLSPGEFATSNVKDPILKIAEVDPLHVEVVLPATQFGKIRKGTRATVRPEAPGGRFGAVVTTVDSIIDGASGTFGVRLELPNPGLRIPAGAKCKLTFGGK